MISSALVLALAMATGAIAAPANEPWITIDRDVLLAFETGYEPAAAASVSALEDPLDVRPDVIAVPMSEERMEELAQFVHERYRRCGGFVFHATREQAYEAAARAARTRETEAAAPHVPYTIDNASVAVALSNAVQESQIRTTIIDLAAFFTRHHNCPTGQQSAQSIFNKWQGYATAANRTDVTVRNFFHTGYTTLQPSVILTIPGTDPTLSSEYVILGGHQDSTAGSNCGRAPGADDDASGIATITEIIRVAMQLGYRPLRTVEFMAYAAEEAGLRGSDQIAQNYGSIPRNVVGVVQYDMTNYAPANATYDIVIYTDAAFTNQPQNAFLQQLAATYFPSTGTFAPRPTSTCGYDCSDHASWNVRGYPASLPFETPFNVHNPFIHTSNDTLAQSNNNANRTVPFAKLGAVYMAEMAKGNLVPFQAKATVRQGRR